MGRSFFPSLQVTFQSCDASVGVQTCGDPLVEKANKPPAQRNFAAAATKDQK